jgi:DNA polymerase elongation subunit (family B)
LYFLVISSSYDSGPHDVDIPIREIRARYQDEPEISFDGSEEILLKDFCKYVLTKDADLLVSTNQQSRSIDILEHFFTRINELGLVLHFGRVNQTNKMEGRICLSHKSFNSDLDLVAVIEKARFAFIPLGLAARYGTTRLIDSRNWYELINRGFVIPRSNNNHERIRTMEEIVAQGQRRHDIFSHGWITRKCRRIRL